MGLGQAQSRVLGLEDCLDPPLSGSRSCASTCMSNFAKSYRFEVRIELTILRATHDLRTHALFIWANLPFAHP